MLQAGVKKKKVLYVRVWDFLFASLILLPFLTGGFQTRILGLYFEISEMSSLTLLVFLSYLLIFKFLKRPAEESFFLTWLQKLGTLWCELWSKSPLQMHLLMASPIALWWSFVSIWQHLHLGTLAWDTGIFVNGYWHIAFDKIDFSSVRGLRLLADHQSYINWIIAPIFHLFPGAETLLIFQSVGLALGGVPLYYLCRQYLPRDERLASLMPIIYWMYYPTRQALFFEFHPETLMLPLFLSAIVGIQSKKMQSRVFGLIALILTLCTKESAGPLVAGLGMSYILGSGPKGTRSFTRVAGIPILLLGLIAFYFDVKVVPTLLGGVYSYTVYYKYLGGSLEEIIQSILFKPNLVISHLIAPPRPIYFFLLLLPFGFLPLLAPASLIIALPGFLMLFLTEGPERISMRFHYSIEPSIGLFYAMMGALFLLRSDRLQVSENKLVRYLLIFSVMGSGTSDVLRLRHTYPTAYQKWVTHEVLPLIDSTIPIAAPSPWVPHLSTRPTILSNDDLNRDSFEKVECVISTHDLSVFKDRLDARGFVKVYECYNLRVFDRSGMCLSKLPKNCVRDDRE
jgi:uncharacterized membrane protein